MSDHDEPSGVRNIALVGAGSIGAGWGIVFASAGFEVRLYDKSPRRRAEVLAEIRQCLQELSRAGLIGESPDSVMRRLVVSETIEATVQGAEFVQENASESVEVKRRIFAELDELVPRQVVLASSTSTIPSSQFAAGLPGRDRCLVIHPVNPPYLIRLAEIVPADFTSSDATRCATSLMNEADMVPIVLGREVEGFAFNRLQGALLREAYFLVGDGVVTPEEIDRLVRDGLGRRWSVTGPFATAELNTRGGIDQHAAVQGDVYARLGAQRGTGNPWTAETMARVSEAVHATLPPQRWAEHVRRRELAMIRLEGLRRRGDVPEVGVVTDDGTMAKTGD